MTYAFEVNVNDVDLKVIVSERRETFENEVDCWHLAIKKSPELLKGLEY